MGSEDAKSHSSSSAAGAGACGGDVVPPAKSSKDDDAGDWLWTGGWNAPLVGRGLADINDAKGSAAWGGVAVCRTCGDGPGAGVEDWEAGREEFKDARIS